MRSFNSPLWFLIGLLAVSVASCNFQMDEKVENETLREFYPSTKPLTRWWWFATEIKKEDVKYQLDWLKAKNFGGVEIAWVYPLHRYQRMYSRKYGREYPIDTTAQKWLSKEFVEIVAYTKRYADSIEMACDFTFGSAWPVASSNLDQKYGTKIYGDTAFRQLLTFAWTWPDTQLVINHLDSNAFNVFSKPIIEAFNPILGNSNTAFFTDSWEIKLNGKNKIWTEGFEEKFKQQFNYDITPFMEKDLDSFPSVRYDYMKLLDSYVIEGFYKPYVNACKELNAISRVQCLASPTNVMTTYSMVDIPESEAMLNNPNYSRIVSSSACLSSKPIVSSETFTCMYGFPSTYLREEQIADLKMVADALFAQGVNFHVYHGTPYNPKGSDTIEFFATTYFGPGGNLENDLPEFNNYIANVSSHMQKGRTYSNVAVYIPYEDGVMAGPYPLEKQRVWVWGQYEMRYINPPNELEGYHPLWINDHFLMQSSFKDGNLKVGDASFSSLYIDVEFMDIKSLKAIHSLAQKGLKVCLKRDPKEPGKVKSNDYFDLIKEMKHLPNVTNSFKKLESMPALIEGENLPSYWCRVDKEGRHLIFLAQQSSKFLEYPIYSGQSYSDSTIHKKLVFNVNGHKLEETIKFKPYQSILIEIDKNGNLRYLDIKYKPRDPEIKPKEKQKMYF